MSATRCELLRWQFELTWSLFDYHLDRLEPAHLHWEAAGHSWAVRPDAAGRWIPDWAEVEPDPIPVPTVAWLTWHIGWWWSVATDHLQSRPPRDRAEVHWPGDGTTTIAWLRELRAEWLTVLDRLTDADLDAVAPFPWTSDPQHTVGHLLAWANAELMKNVAEIGQLRLLHEAQTP